MAADTRSNSSFGTSGHNLIRVLIASYFIAVSIDLIAGTSGIALAALVLPPAAAELVGSSVLFIFGSLVLTGIWLRPAAMLLGITILLSSFVQYFGPAAVPLADLWRDLTLTGALLLTYSQAALPGQQNSTFAQWTPNYRNTEGLSKIRPRRIVTVAASNIARLPAKPKPPSVFRRVDNIFVDEREDVLAS
ncbi:MAG: hypothetical protein V3V25_09695 [Paracoccaceae bacterium]